METRGHLKEISVSYPSREAVITFAVTALDGKTIINPQDLERYRTKDLRVTIKEYREKRSISANAYYWVLLSKTAAKMGISSSRLHNLLLRDYGKPYIIGGKVAIITIPDTDKAEQEALESDTFHIKPTDHVAENSKGTAYRSYIVLEGSHTMNSKEFSQLLDHLIQEAKDQGVETATPDEIARMKMELEQHDKAN